MKKTTAKQLLKKQINIGKKLKELSPAEKTIKAVKELIRMNKARKKELCERVKGFKEE